MKERGNRGGGAGPLGTCCTEHQRAPPSPPRPLLPAVLSVFSRTPQLQARLGQDVLIDCGFSGPASPFSVEWRLQHGGAGRVVLAYDGAARKVSVAEKGTRLFLDPETNNVSLQLQGVAARQEGTYICTVYLPHLRAQQAMELKVVGKSGWVGGLARKLSLVAPSGLVSASRTLCAALLASEGSEAGFPFPGRWATLEGGVASPSPFS